MRRLAPLLVALALLAGALPLASPGFWAEYGYDLAAYRHAALALAAGVSPYTDARLGEPGAYWYPPPAALLFSPLAALDPGVATALLGLVSLALLALALYRLAGGGPWGGFVALAGAGSPIVWPATIQGNVGTLVVALLAGVFLAERAGRQAASGILLALAASLKLTPAALLVLLWLRGRRRAVGAALLAGGLLVAFTLVFESVRAGWLAYPAVLARIGGEAVRVPRSFSLPDLLEAAGVGADPLRRALPLVALALVARAARLRPPHAFALSLVAIGVGTSLAWMHYATLWLPALAVLAAEPGRRRWLIVGALGALAAAPGVYPHAAAVALCFWAPAALVAGWVVAASWPPPPLAAGAPSPAGFRRHAWRLRTPARR